MSIVTNQYIKWTNTAEEVSHVGILTIETPTHITFLTKCGEMTIPLGDGEFTEATREDFEAAVVATPEPVVVTVKGTKSEQAASLVKTMQDEGADRKAIIAALMETLSISKGNAGIYYSKSTK